MQQMAKTSKTNPGSMETASHSRGQIGRSSSQSSVREVGKTSRSVLSMEEVGRDRNLGSAVREEARTQAGQSARKANTGRNPLLERSDRQDQRCELGAIKGLLEIRPHRY